MERLLDINPNSKDFWNIQYAPDRRDDYKRLVWSIAYSQKYEIVPKYVPYGGVFLDLACGFGLVAKAVAESGKSIEVWASDQSDCMIEDLKKDNEHEINYVVSELGDGKLPENYFDTVFAGDLVEHLTEPTTLFTVAYKLLKQHGKLLITTPDGDVRPYIASPDHVWLLDHEDVEKLYKDNGFSEPEFLLVKGDEGVQNIYAIATKV